MAYLSQRYFKARYFKSRYFTGDGPIAGKPIVKFKGVGGNWIFGSRKKELEEEKKKLVIHRRILRRRIKKKQPIRETDIPAAISANLQPNQMLIKIDALIEEVDIDLKRRKKRDEEDIIVLTSY